jgi:high-affinity K+ transport system ATPase subunit B
MQKHIEDSKSNIGHSAESSDVAELRNDGGTPKPTIRERLTYNAIQFDGIIVDMLRERDDLLEAMQKALVMIGASNDDKPPCVKESKINQAWHVLKAAIAKVEG